MLIFIGDLFFIQPLHLLQDVQIYIEAYVSESAIELLLRSRWDLFWCSCTS